MPKFALAFISFHNNTLEISFVEARNPTNAALNFLADKGYEMTETPDLEKIKQECFDADCMIDVKELPSA